MDILILTTSVMAKQRYNCEMQVQIALTNPGPGCIDILAAMEVLLEISIVLAQIFRKALRIKSLLNRIIYRVSQKSFLQSSFLSGPKSVLMREGFKMELKSSILFFEPLPSLGGEAPHRAK